MPHLVANEARSDLINIMKLKLMSMPKFETIHGDMTAKMKTVHCSRERPTHSSLGANEVHVQYQYDTIEIPLAKHERSGTRNEFFYRDHDDASIFRKKLIDSNTFEALD